MFITQGDVSRETCENMTGMAIFLRILNGLLMLGIPALGAFFLVRRGRGGFRPIGIGIAGFILSQVGHIPFNQFLLLPGLRSLGIDLAAQGGWSLWTLGVAAGLSAAVFEELVRYLAFRFWLQRDSGAYTPWKYGIGHGGVEAILAGLLVLYALVQVMALGGEGVLEGFPADQADQIRAQLEAYWAVPWHQSLLGAWERVSAMLFHLGASVFVFKSVREKKIHWLLIALLGHTALDAFAVIAVKQMGVVLIEALLFTFALLWAAWAWYVRPREEGKGDLGPPPAIVDLSASKITSEHLEESRYE